MTDRFDEDMMEDLMAEAPEAASAADEPARSRKSKMAQDAGSAC